MRRPPQTLTLPALISTALAAGAWLALVRAKTFERCELAQELRYRHGLPAAQVPTWVCIARFESLFNTSAVGRLSGGSLDHGLFQMSDAYWCSPPGRGTACGLSCDKLVDNDISDDVECALRVYREHQRLSGDGFNAWVVYQRFCSRGRADHYVDDCFEKPVNANVV
ncbi:lysozyme c-1-like [Schistocerca americana]|uniref:lysozyme c-1-like n=1 Tax=Schistocerca americana TaxID=7009 RepID=UPI001F4FB7F7|nr:lysozyme c-1-like [Schistocerca americana]